jgi:DNA-binding beta-propeller fold protein YncE
MRRALLAIPALLLLAFVASCGTGFKLPAEVRRAASVANGTYARIDTWTGLDRLNDILLTKAAEENRENLYLLFRTEGTDTGSVRAYPLFTQVPFSFRYRGMLHPVALCGNATRLFVLDQGDTCLARTNPVTGKCDTTGNFLLPQNQKWTNAVSRLDLYWRVREYFPDGDTVSTFTDTTMAWVHGIAVDDQQRIYVSGLFIEVAPNPDNVFLHIRSFVWRVHRYVRGGGDPNMPGCAWHRDPGYAVTQGAGLSNCDDPQGIDWSPANGGALYIGDRGNSRGLRRGDPPTLESDYSMLTTDEGALQTPVDVSADLAGFAYLADDTRNSVSRFRPAGQGLSEFVQRVDIEGTPIAKPVAVAADNGLVYIADGQRNELVIYRRRQ